MAAPVDQHYYSPFNPWLTAVVATLATFMEVLDTSIANVALPHISGNLGASVTDSTWVLTSYLVANAIVLPATAWLSSAIGRRNYYMLSVAIFTVSSFLCGTAQNLSMLVFFRLLQGLGGGGLQPTTQAILVDTFPPRQRGMGMAVYGITVVCAPVIGPTLGGWITDNYSWRWIFFINIPVGILSLVLSSRIIADPPYLVRRTGAARWRVDYVGLGLIAVGLGALQMMLDLGERYDWFSSPFITASAVVSGLCLFGGVLWELGHNQPILDLKLLGERNLGLSCLTMLIFGAVLFGTTALLPLLMQTLLGYTAELSGLVLSPGGLVIGVMMPVIGWMVTRFDQRRMMVFGTLVISYSLWRMSRFTLGVDFWTIVTARMVQGFGLAFMFVPVNTIAYANVSPQQRNNASSLMSIARNIGGSLGIGLMAAALASGSQVHQAMMTRHLTPYNPAYQQTLQRLQGVFSAQGAGPAKASALAHAVIERTTAGQASMLTYLDQFRILAAAFLLLIPIVLLMRRPRIEKGHKVELAME